MKIGLGGLALLSIHAAAASAHPENSNINAVYERLVQARVAADVDGMAAAFPAEAILIDARPSPPIGGGHELQDRLRPQVERMVAEGVKIRTKYRVERRSVSADFAVDAGYMRMEMVRPGAEPNVRYARFLVTMKRDASSQWRIIADASMPADEARWNAAPRVPGARYDD